MIRTSLVIIVFIYLLASLGTILLAWLLAEWRRQREERAASRNLIRCNICSFAYRDNSASPLSTCPECGSLNERTSFKLT